MNENRNDGPVVVGVFSNRWDSQRAVRELREAGFSEDQIGILGRDSDEGVVEEADAGNAAAGAATGALAGAGVGGLWALGIAAGLLPAIGPVIAGGMFASLLASAAAGAAAGGVAGALIGAGVPNEEADQYEESFHEGKTLVTVRDGGVRAASIMCGCNAEVRSHGNQANTLATDTACVVPSGSGLRAQDKEQSLKLRAEEIDVQKRPVEKGKVRLRKEVVHETKTIDVPVTREEIVIERRPVEGAEPAGAIGAESRDIRIPVREEEVSVQKRPVVKEEVSVGKRTVQETKRMTADVKHEELRVEEKGDVRTNERRPR